MTSEPICVVYLVLISLIGENVFLQEFYDFQGNYTRIDLKQPPTGNMTYDIQVSPMTLINDFNTGLLRHQNSRVLPLLSCLRGGGWVT